ncbi:hypothetical protein [Pseudonocardia acaciae]|uniref:hypothetical protein n=1 Tax=Pseudonocardia acaciae TaxID=551276 RepID=UPI000684C3F7|nr:hypothetical protein [Pseudonocardia acaciae]
MGELALSRTVISFDVVGSSAGDRHRQVHLDRTLDEVTKKAIDKVRDPQYPIAGAYRRTDGDSLTMVVDKNVAISWIISDFVLRELVIALGEANRRVKESYRLRVRVAIDHGETVLHEPHVAGDAVICAARLRDAPPLREAMKDRTEADLGLIVSDRIYNDVVVHGERGLMTTPFEAVQVSVKDFTDQGWIHLPVGQGSDGQARTPKAPSSPSETKMFQNIVGTVNASHSVIGIGWK